MQKRFSTVCKSVAVAAFVCMPSLMVAQTVVFSENFGMPVSEKDEDIAEHVWNNPAEMYTWSDASLINVRYNNPSNGYEGASGDGNLYFNEEPVSFTVSGINTAQYEDVLLSFGIFGKSAGAARQMKVSYNDNHGDEVLLVDTKDAGLAALAKGWELVSGLVLPASENLSLTFSSYAGDVAAEIRIDDLTITGKEKTVTSIPDAHVLPVIYTDARHLHVEGIEENVSVYSVAGNKVGEWTAATACEAELPVGVYVVKVRDIVRKVVVK